MSKGTPGRPKSYDKLEEEFENLKLEHAELLENGFRGVDIIPTDEDHRRPPESSVDANLPLVIQILGSQQQQILNQAESMTQQIIERAKEDREYERDRMNSARETERTQTAEYFKLLQGLNDKKFDLVMGIGTKLLDKGLDRIVDYIDTKGDENDPILNLVRDVAEKGADFLIENMEDQMNLGNKVSGADPSGGRPAGQARTPGRHKVNRGGRVVQGGREK